MNVNTMRAIDYYAGVPLTFLSTLLLKTRSLFSSKEYNYPRNTLLIELSEMGSAILVDPAMRKLQKQIDGELFFVIFRSNRASLKLLGTIKDENIFTIDESSMVALAVSTLKFFAWCRQKKIDSVIDLELFSRFTALLSGFCGASNRVGFHSFYNEGLYRGDLLTHKVAYNPHQHIAKNFIALTDALVAQKEQTPYTKRVVEDSEITLAKCSITQSQQEAVSAKIGELYSDFTGSTQLILINSNASDLLPERRWDRKNYSEVIKMILANSNNALILLTGAPSEKDGAQELADSVADKRCINFAGEIEFLQLPHLYSISSFMITNDSGPAHFAAITDMHTFVIFGPETPALYGSLGSSTPIYANMSCSPCVSAANHRKTACDDNQCIQIITPQIVYNTIASRLS